MSSLLLQLGLLAMAMQGCGFWWCLPAMRRMQTTWKHVAWSTTALSLSTAVVVLMFQFAQLDIEQYSWFFWTCICCSAAATGALCVRYGHGLHTWALAWAVLFTSDLAIVSVVIWQHFHHTASVFWRSLLLMPPVLALLVFFGASLFYVIDQDNLTTPAFAPLTGYEFFLSRRFLLSKSSSVLSTVTKISLVGVCLGVWLVLVSLGILAGFENDLQRKIMGANGHVVLRPSTGEVFDWTPDLQTKLRKTSHLQALAPFVESEVAIASESNYTGAVLFGVDTAQSLEVLQVLQHVLQGHLPPGHDVNDVTQSLPGLIIGVEMANALHVQVGDKLRVISPLLEILTPLGPAPKSMSFVVVAIFNSKMYEYDARYVYTTLPASRDFLELGQQSVSGIHLLGKYAEHAFSLSQAATKTLLPASFVGVDWQQSNATLFAALKLERAVAFVVLVFIILVASFSIVNTLTMSIIEKRREIAILKTIGARDVGILKIFLGQGLLVGMLGTCMGAILGVLTIKFLEHFGFWIPGDVYYIDSLPVKLQVADVVLVVVAAWLIVWDFSVFPALQGAALQPVEGLRDG